MNRISLLSALVGFAGIAAAQPDVIVGDLTGIAGYGSSGGIFAYSVGTTSCNAGDVPLNWIANTNQHPVIGQRLYRWRVVNGVGQFDQVGASHLKHGFTALQGTVCYSDCQAHPDGSRLGVHCSDPYGSFLNGDQFGLGPRDEVNAYTGAYPYPFTSRSPSTGTIARRLQVLAADLDPAQGNPAATTIYLCEGQYIAPDDAAAGNGANNASYRRVTRSSGTGNWAFVNTIGFTTQRGQAAIFGWQTIETGVTIHRYVVPGEAALGGVIDVAYKVTPYSDGSGWHYEYMVHNQNSDISLNSFIVNFPGGGQTGCIDIENVGFRDVAYHSGEPYDGTDWANTKTATAYQWIGPTYSEASPNGNALRWGTSFSFRFDSTRYPVTGTATIGLFKTGGSMSVPLLVPNSCPCPEPDYNCDGAVNGFDIQATEEAVNGDFSNFCAGSADLNGDGAENGFDIQYAEERVNGAPC
ncbi:hypothetical protein PHYC_02767 [Phycisphaerales bacterium]|nr:hypothetical protein PHYC_02767 [Phycisphaerales bacterium]